MPLTAMALTHEKPKEKSYKLNDARGLYLLITTEGHRYWRFNYRFSGKYRTLAFGVYPDVSLADARAKRDAARKILAADEDPVEWRKREERAAKTKVAPKQRAALVIASLTGSSWLYRAQLALLKSGRALLGRRAVPSASVSFPTPLQT